MAMTVKVTTTGNYSTLRIAGRIVGVDSEKFKKKLGSFCAKKDTKLVLDLSRTEFIDSFGLGSLVRYHMLLQNDGRTLVVFNKNTSPTSYIHRLFEHTGLDTVFTIAHGILELKATSE